MIRGSRTTLALGAALAFAAAPVAAQLSQFSWELKGQKTGSGMVSGEALYVLGPDGGSCFPEDTTWFETTAPAAGTVRALVRFESFDFGCSPPPPDDGGGPVAAMRGGPQLPGDDGPQESGLFDLAIYKRNGLSTNITFLCFGVFEDFVEFEVDEGDTFGWGVESKDCFGGPGLTEVKLLTFTPAVFADVGNALDPRLRWSVDGDTPIAETGYAVAAAGDTNGDGIPDVLVGSPGPGLAQLHSGADGTLLRTLEGDYGYGNAVAGVGDVDGDGAWDLVVADDSFDTSTGQVTVCSGASGDALTTWTGAQALQLLGRAVAGPGDVNGDGVPDVLIGAPGNPERVRLYSGADLVYEFGASDENYGHSVDGAGDVDADGFPDMLIGASFGNRVEIRSGATGDLIRTLSGDDLGASMLAVRFGDAVSGAGDVDGDGFDDVLVGDPLARLDDVTFGGAFLYSGADGSLLEALWGATPFSSFGDALDGGRDVDGDGLPDIIVGAPDGVDGSAMPVGVVSVFSGADRASLQRFEGLAAGGGAGAAVALLGDVDGDGLPDAIFGMPDAGDGRAQVVSALDRSTGRPTLTGSGTLQPGAPFAIQLTDALPDSAAWLVLGLAELAAPFKGGVLVPAPDAVLPIFTGPAGTLEIAGTWPSGVPAYTSFWMQAWIVDPLGPQGLSASNALRSFTP